MSLSIPQGTRQPPPQSITQVEKMVSADVEQPWSKVIFILFRLLGVF